MTSESVRVTRVVPTFASGDSELDDGYRWAVARALDWVTTGHEGAIPSYWAGLTDRPMFYGRDFVHQALAGHLLGLDVENASMYDALIDSATPARGGYPLWSFFFDGSVPELDYHSDDDFVREVPLVFELVERALELHLWTGDERYRSALWSTEYQRAAVTEFVAGHDPLGWGVAGEAGSGDIFAGSASYSEGPQGVALRVGGDGIASQIAALRALATQSPDAPFAAWAATESQRVNSLFEELWWDAESAHYATGFGADGPILEFGYEPSWFPAVKAVMSPDRARGHLAWITSELAKNPPHNIEAFTYLPEAFLRYDDDEAALHWLRHLIASRADYPEVSFLVVSTMLAGLTGIRPLADGTLETRTHLPGRSLEVCHVPFRDHLLDVHHDGSETTTLTVHGGDAAITWRSWNNGRRTETLINPGERIRVDGVSHPERRKTT